MDSVQAVIVTKESFDQLIDNIQRLTSEIRVLQRQVRKDDRLYNIKETAKKLNISTPTLYSLMKAGLIEPKTVGNSKYFTQEIIDEYVSSKQ